MKTNKKHSIARYMKEFIAQAITATINCIDFIPLSSLATQRTLKVLKILTDLKALNEVFLPVPP
ncbi:MAG: hypothetical protein IPK55_13470 [Streptococcus sp.]|nr:hypothetical protein [Streptococcus sp.]